MLFDEKPEVLAPAGTVETVAAVIEAGADAVYLGGKQFNMRSHRSSYNLDEGEVSEAIALAHEKDCRLYFVLNSLLNEEELPALRETLNHLGGLGPDAIIVQDLGVASMAREICVHIPLFASTMMNVHSAESAKTLKLMGFKRIIPSRDIPLHEVRRIAEASGLEMEYFVHGDMCIAHSSLCYLSGVAFGESANCGRCMKPCRWEWELIPENPNVDFSGDFKQGYLMARKDMCMLQHIPALVQNGIVSLKIEGRMRTAEFLKPLIGVYREAVDAYFDDPIHYATRAKKLFELWRTRVRDFSTLHAFGNPGAISIEPLGKREPRFFSTETPEAILTVGEDAEPAAGCDLELIAHVGTAPAAEAAVEAGANAIYIGGETYIRHKKDVDFAWLAKFVPEMAGRGVRVAVLGARVTDEREMNEWRWWLRKLLTVDGLGVGVSNLGALHAVRSMLRGARSREIVADFPLNVTNSVAADELSTLGATRITASIEFDYERLCRFTDESRMPIEVIGHGPLDVMVLEHCFIAAATGDSPEGVCPMNCRLSDFSMRDAGGREYRLEADRRCRNHLYMADDICVAPNLSRMVSAGIAGLRIEAQFDRPKAVATVVGAYRRAIETLRAGNPYDVQAALREIRDATGRGLSDGPFGFDRVRTIGKEDECVSV